MRLAAPARHVFAPAAWARCALSCWCLALLLTCWEPALAAPGAPAAADLVESRGLLIDRSGTVTIENAATQAFQPTPTQSFFGNQAHPVWLQVRLKPAPAGTSWQLALWPPFIHSATLYQETAPGHWTATTMGSRYPFVDRPAPSLGLDFPLTLRSDGPTTVYLQLQTPSPSAIVEVLQPQDLAARERLSLFVFSTFFGVASILLFISVAAWWVTPMRIWIVFGGLDLMTTLSVLVQSGLAAMYFVPESSNLLNQLHPYFVFGQVFFAAAVFVENCRFIQAPALLRRGFGLVMLLLPIKVVLVLLGHPGPALWLNNMSALFMVPLTLVLAFTPNKGDRIIGLAVRASALYCVAVFGVFLLPWVSFLHMEQLEFYARYSTAPAVVFTACITLTIAFRQTQLALRERHQLQEQAKESERQRAAAIQASEAKSAFLAYMSHEIRTPLNAVVGLAELARDRELPEAERHDYLERLCDSAENLSQTISEVLDLSKIESRSMPSEPTDFDLDALLRSLLAGHMTLAHRKGLALRMAPAQPNFGWVLGDPLRLRHILGNYLSNALKYTQQGEIVLNARQIADGHFRFEVCDTGPGMTPDEQERLFTPYVQVGRLPERSTGTGLGLSICRELAQLLGGAVGVDSRPGQGSRFWVELPLKPGGAMSPPAAEPPDTGELLLGKRVLVADDVDSNRLFMEALLRREGGTPLAVSDGAQAVDAVRRAAAEGRPFDIVFLDVHMPVMDGLEAARRIRQLGDAGRLPIVAISGGVLLEERQRVVEAGMNEFLAKPLTLKRLRACVQVQLGSATSAAAGPA